MPEHMSSTCSINDSCWYQLLLTGIPFYIWKHEPSKAKQFIQVDPASGLGSAPSSDALILSVSQGHTSTTPLGTKQVTADHAKVLFHDQPKRKDSAKAPHVL